MEFSNESSLRTQGPQRERKGLIAAARTLASALEQRPFLTSEARGYGSLRPQGRPAERLYEATTASTYGSIQLYAIAPRVGGRAGEGVTRTPAFAAHLTLPHKGGGNASVLASRSAGQMLLATCRESC